jgi:hypothetical protein
MGRSAMVPPGELHPLESLASHSHRALLDKVVQPDLERPRRLAALDQDVPVCVVQAGAPATRDQLPGAVRRAAAAAFAPEHLGGLALHSSGVVHVPASAYSQTVELFRAELGTYPGLATWPDSELVAEYERSWRGAVDAGACLLAGGEVERTPYGPLLKPTLLVNVPADSAWAAPGRPLAQIRLVRHPD